MKEETLSRLEGDILTVLGQNTLYGLQILRLLNEGRPNTLNRPSQGSIYPILSRMEEKGLLLSEEGDQNDESGGGNRKYFTCTEYGRSILRQWTDYREGLYQRSGWNDGTGPTSLDD